MKWQPTAWKIPWAEEPGGLQSMELQRVRHDYVTESVRAHARARAHTHTHTHTHKCVENIKMMAPLDTCLMARSLL